MALAGCGGDGTLEAGTTPISDGTQVSSHLYLADSVGAGEAISDFVAVLNELPTPVRPAALEAAAAELGAARDRATVIAGRLAAQRLEDRRLEEQRAAASAALAPVVAAMDGLVGAAEAGDPEAAERASRLFNTAVGKLRSLPAPS